MTGRLIVAIVTTVLEEAVIAAILFWGLPELGIRVPLAAPIAVMAAWLAYSIFTYRMGSRALTRKQMPGLPHMVGSTGRVVVALKPDGLVRIRGELWLARSVSGDMPPGRDVVVVGQDGLKLEVRESSDRAETR